jgi:S-adenosylmethionine:tRNA ribosyltransferase-isomerase
MMNEYRSGDELIKGVVDRKILTGATLSFKNGATLTVAKQEEQFFFFRPSVAMPAFWKLLMAEGITPIPPYIKGASLSETALREKYQSVLAKHPASIAAPTASLHFTNRLLDKLEEKHVTRTEVTLHVGAGTFAPIDETNFRTKKLFTEYIEVTGRSADAINSAKASGIPIIPVGTTAMRTIESAADPVQGRSLYEVGSCTEATNIFIYPPYTFKIADGLITNFHVPKSSLLLLVDALLKHKKAKRDILDLYDIAIKEKFRFYSFGDGMLIL